MLHLGEKKHTSPHLSKRFITFEPPANKKLVYTGFAFDIQFFLKYYVTPIGPQCYY